MKDSLVLKIILKSFFFCLLIGFDISCIFQCWMLSMEYRSTYPFKVRNGWYSMQIFVWTKCAYWLVLTLRNVLKSGTLHLENGAKWADPCSLPLKKEPNNFKEHYKMKVKLVKSKEVPLSAIDHIQQWKMQEISNPFCRQKHLILKGFPNFERTTLW